MLDYLSFIILILQVIIYYNLVKSKKDTENSSREKVSTSLLNPIEVNGMYVFNKKEIFSSTKFKQIQKEDRQSSYPSMVSLLKEFMIPYASTEYYKVIKQIRDLSAHERGTAYTCYKQLLTASAILFNKPILKSLYSDDIGVLLYCNFYLEINELIDFDKNMDYYIKNEYHTIDSADVQQSHSDLLIFIQDLDLLNLYLYPTFEYEHYVTIEHLYKSWLISTGTRSKGYSKYKESIDEFKKLLTIYYGILQMDIPRSYYYFTPAIVDYILQSKRYSGTKLSLAVDNSSIAV